MGMMHHINAKFLNRPFLWCDNAILIYLALTKLVIHLLTANGYGYFGDELYWQSMAKHLDFGYVDVPPLVAYLAALSRFLIGTSLFAIHIFPAVAGAVTVYFAGLIARELGGGRFAQWFSALAALVTPWLLLVDSIFTYDPFDQLGTIILFYLAVQMINRETPRRWILFGIIAGLGVMTKLTMLSTGGALVISLIFTSRRKSFLTVWPWLALFIAALICTPYLMWQSAHGWPLLTYWQNYALNPYRPQQQLVQFITALIFQLNPWLLPVLLLGLVYFLVHGEGKKYRILGFTFLILAVFYTGLMKLESRQLVSACFPLLAAGAVWLEKMFTASAINPNRISWFKWVYIGIIIISVALLTPISLPLLPVSALEKYWSAAPSFFRENDYMPGRIPFKHRNSLGWPEMIKEVAMIYHSLPEADRKKCLIWAGFYAEAGAIDLLGKQYGLPDAMSNNLSYKIWGEERFNSGNAPEVAIMLNDFLTRFPAYVYYEDVTVVKTFNTNKYSVYSGRSMTIYVCRKPKAGFLEVWRKSAIFN